MRRARGFTLIEILISLALAGLVVAGALQLHASFNRQSIRQDAVNDVQQAVRMSMQIIERAIRSGGSGMVGQQLIMNSSSGIVSYYGVQYRNVNTFPWPVAYDSVAADNDTDPDQIKVITNEPPSNPTNLFMSDTSNVAAIKVPPPGIVTGWSVHDLFLVMGSTSVTSCLREVTAVGATSLSHAAGGTSYSGINLLSPDACLTAFTTPVPIRRFVHETIYKVFPASGDVPPKLAMRYATIGDVTNTPAWNLIADNIEDIQIALLMQDGTVCNDRDNPALCDPSLVRALRVTLVGRTAQKLPGAPSGQTGGYEDEAATAVTDGYLRRALTSEILLRN